MAVIKFSRQREAIKSYLAQTTSHPTAATIYEELRTDHPNISLGTVYRNLNFLVEQGEILKISCDDGSDHFDGNTNPHYHFVCTSCHQVSDLDLPDMEHVNVLASANFAGKIVGHTTYFYGTCPQCLKQSQRVSDTVD
ncbi:Fur family transcriptional regulator [Anaeromicropila populeti]|uniref:Fur family transcriptional regulator, peroxide stress response regulator n=1 Tax=Anaeromicropila populeti TaxID=37658 RepID=A0A1I6IWZ0_9FIRM|nr:transcriptional repressor [Anaeromicropila populeti]SFR71266.1 Fur family transcriptional regulator, peroxide stress response regulator [Anaeromicropila populeti]